MSKEIQTSNRFVTTKGKTLGKSSKPGALQMDAVGSGDPGFETLFIVLDRSSSMLASYDSDMDPTYNPSANSKSRSAASQEAVNLLWDNTNFAICDLHLVCFNEQPQEVSVDVNNAPTILPPQGGTQFTNALQLGIDGGASRMILVSDGEAEYPQGPVTHCKANGIKIDTIFIGPIGSSGEALLKRISDETEGMSATAEDADDLMEAMAQLDTTKRLQLEHHPGQIEHGVIKL